MLVIIIKYIKHLMHETMQFIGIFFKVTKIMFTVEKTNITKMYKLSTKMIG